MYDYLIIGAGLACSMLGYLLQKEGYNVIFWKNRNYIIKRNYAEAL